jgi:hypothetical protein
MSESVMWASIWTALYRCPVYYLCPRSALDTPTEWYFDERC